MALMIITALVFAWVAVATLVAGLCWAARRGDADIERAPRRRFVPASGERDAQHLIVLR